MSANLDTTLGFEALAFAGPRSAIWHRGGQSIDAKTKELGRPLTMDELWSLAGCNFTVEKVYLVVDLQGSRFDHLPPAKRIFAYPDRFAHVRTDVGNVLGMGSDRYQLVQPAAVKDLFAHYLETDERFQITTVGALNGGKRIWAQAVFNGDHEVAGDRHRSKLLMSTTFDASDPTRLQCCEERVVCENTIRIAMSEHAPAINVRHSTVFNRDTAVRQLAQVTKGFARYKQIGDALAQEQMTRPEIAAFIRDVLDVPKEVAYSDLPTRTKTRQQAVIDAILVSANERAVNVNSNVDAFTMLQGITRYVDHSRDADNTESRLFGSGAALKNKALDLLMPRIKDKVLA